jgi:hypothetical protein
MGLQVLWSKPCPPSMLSTQQQLCGNTLRAGPSLFLVHRRSPTCHLACWLCTQKEGCWRNWCSHQPAASHLMSSLDHEWHMHACGKRRKNNTMYLSSSDPWPVGTPRGQKTEGWSLRHTSYPGAHVFTPHTPSPFKNITSISKAPQGPWENCSWKTFSSISLRGYFLRISYAIRR